MKIELAWGFSWATLEARGQWCIAFKVFQVNDFEKILCPAKYQSNMAIDIHTHKHTHTHTHIDLQAYDSRSVRHPTQMYFLKISLSKEKKGSEIKARYKRWRIEE